MSDFILKIILIGSLGVIVYLIGRTVPRLGEEEASPKPVRNFLARLPVHKFDAALAGILEKSLRRLRVIILRVDNNVIGYLHRMKIKALDVGRRRNRKSIFTDMCADETHTTQGRDANDEVKS